ncbi:559_t:CDS:2 [Rhizophagus irregularis]|nr:559_t:CDS:2 [Rhizophagus irregularis]
MLSSNKHLGNNQISRTSEDTIFRYYEDTDMLSIYLLTYTILPSVHNAPSKSTKTHITPKKPPTRITINCLVHGETIDCYFTVFQRPSELLCCRLFETSETIDNKPPFAFYPEDRDEVEVLFVGSKPLPITFEKTENKDFEVGINDEKLCYFTMQVADCLKRYRRRREKNLRKKRG